VVHASDSFKEGIIKAVKTSRSELAKIMTKPHKIFVHMQEVFYHDGQIFFLYELLDVSLAQIFGSPLGCLRLFEVAAFSKEILVGVQYIHEALRITRGSLSSSNILLSTQGVVKIGMEL
jgi:serine/threonine protein kinase